MIVTGFPVIVPGDCVRLFPTNLGSLRLADDSLITRGEFRSSLWVTDLALVIQVDLRTPSYASGALVLTSRGAVGWCFTQYLRPVT